MVKPALFLCLLLMTIVSLAQTERKELINLDSTVVKIIEDVEVPLVNKGVPVLFDNKEAKIIAKTFVNKGGKVHPEIVEYYLEFDGKQHWIKFSASKVSVAAVKALVGQSIYFDGRIEDGLWDTDDQNVQSRVGTYLVIKRLRK